MKKAKNLSSKQDKSNADFLNPVLNVRNLDRFHIRKEILSSLQRSLPHLSGKLLDIGCGKMPYKGFILQHSSVAHYMGLDIESARIYDTEIQPDFRWDGVSMPFKGNKFDCAIGTEVLEHCPEPKIILQETHRVLKEGGVFFFTVPFLWNLHEIPNDEYRYTPFALERLLKETGFTDIQLNAHGGWHASLAQMIGLWVRRAPLSDRKRKFLSQAALPIVKFLLKKEEKMKIGFKKPIMITGLSGLARKATQ